MTPRPLERDAPSSGCRVTEAPLTPHKRGDVGSSNDASRRLGSLSGWRPPPPGRTDDGSFLSAWRCEVPVPAWACLRDRRLLHLLHHPERLKVLLVPSEPGRAAQHKPGARSQDLAWPAGAAPPAKSQPISAAPTGSWQP